MGNARQRSPVCFRGVKIPPTLSKCTAVSCFKFFREGFILIHFIMEFKNKEVAEIFDPEIIELFQKISKLVSELDDTVTELKERLKTV